MLGRILAGFINFFTALVALFLGMRVLLRLFGANPEAPFVQWVYASTGPLLQPFRGIFPTETIARDYVIDFTTLFALMVYGLFGMALLSLVLYLTPPEPVIVKKKRR
jgi:uncharacterized protein YggT (Ycf19 family)